MYRSIGVLAAIFLYLYTCGDLYGWDFPGSAAVRRYRESARPGNIDWAAIKHLDYNSHVRRHCPADVFKRRRIDLRRMYKKLKASYPDYQGLWRVDSIVLQQMDPGCQVEAVAACSRITLRDLVRSHGLRMSEAKRARLINCNRVQQSCREATDETKDSLLCRSAGCTPVMYSSPRWPLERALCAMTHKGKLCKPKLWQSKRTEGTPNHARCEQKGKEVSQSQEGKGKTGFSSSPS